MRDGPQGKDRRVTANKYGGASIPSFSPGGWALPLADMDPWLGDEGNVSPHWLHHRLTDDFQQRWLAFSLEPVAESRPVLLVSSEGSQGLSRDLPWM